MGNDLFIAMYSTCSSSGFASGSLACFVLARGVQEQKEMLSVEHQQG